MSVPAPARKAAKRTKPVGPSRLQLESEIFAQAKMLERLQEGLEGGEFDESVYRGQVSASLRELFALQKKYEEKGHSFPKFLEAQKNLSDLRKVLAKVAELNQSYLSNAGNNLATLQQRTYKAFAAAASDLTASFITLLDCIKLRGVAKPDLLMELFADIVSHADKVGLSPDYMTRLTDLQAELKEKTDELSEEDLDLLDHQVDVLFTEFQLDLKKEPKAPKTSQRRDKTPDSSG
jgi:HEPN domain-containing protein